jgi:glycosyltransferase involved in cell wall biosynthesis
LEYLARRYTLDLILFRQPGSPDPAAALPAGLAQEVTVLQLPVHRRSAAARAWRNATRMARRVPPLVDRFAGFERQVADAVAGRRYDIGLIEHFWCAPYLDAIGPACRRTVLDLHNVESVLHARCAEAEPLGSRIGHRVFRKASLRLEREWLPRFSSVLAASEADAATARAIAPGASVRVYPNAIAAPPLPEHSVPGRRNVIVFSGNLEYHPNLSAVRFFRSEVWPKLRAEWPELVWRLVGKNPEAVRRTVAGDPRIEVRGPVDDAVGELARAGIAIVPLLAGSGTRFKILEAWAAGLPVVSTTIGAEGLPVRQEREILLADGPAEFAAAVSRLLACTDLADRLGKAGRLLLQNEFTWEKAWGTLDF